MTLPVFWRAREKNRGGELVRLGRLDQIDYWTKTIARLETSEYTMKCPVELR